MKSNKSTGLWVRHETNGSFLVPRPTPASVEGISNTGGQTAANLQIKCT